MAIARVANSAVENTTGTSLTFSYTVASGSNRELFVGVLLNASSPPNITGVTFNSDAMTKLIEKSRGAGGFTSSIWFLAAPDVATGNIVVSLDGSVDVYAGAANYSGASQTAPTGDALKSFTSESASAATMNPVSIGDDSWAFTFARNLDGTILLGTNYLPFNASSVSFGDSNGGMGTAGTETVEPTTAIATRWGGVVTAAFAPATASGPANVKTYNGVTAANTKTVNGIAIANVKTKNGIA